MMTIQEIRQAKGQVSLADGMELPMALMLPANADLLEILHHNPVVRQKPPLEIRCLGQGDGTYRLFVMPEQELRKLPALPEIDDDPL